MSLREGLALSRRSLPRPLPFPRGGRGFCGGGRYRGSSSERTALAGNSVFGGVTGAVLPS